MTDQSYGLTISKLLMDAEPGLLVCDPGSTARATGSLANVMGALLASVLAKQGPETYQKTLKFLVVKIHDSAEKTLAEAQRKAANGPQSVN